MIKVFVIFTLLYGLPARAEIFADLLIRHRPASAEEDQHTTVRFQLEHEKVPRIVAHFIGLATGRRAWIDQETGAIRRGVPYYDGQIFHRLIHDFVIQGGDPQGTGSGGPGYVVQDQFDQSLRHSGRYMLSCAKTTNPNTFGSQFFITLEETPHLDDKHPVFGEVVNVSEEDTSSRDFVDALTSNVEYPTGAGDVPLNPITIVSVTFSGADYEGFDIHDPALRLPVVRARTSTFDHDPEAARFVAKFDREAQHSHQIWFSYGAENWFRFRSVLSLDAQAGFEYSVGGAPTKLFYREVAVDYSALYNPPPDILTDGASLLFQEANGDFLKLISDGAGGGTWEDESGGSGDLTEFVVTDSAPATGEFTNSADQAEFIPLMGLKVTFEDEVGEDGFTSLNGNLSFHTETIGGFEGLSNVQGVSFNRPFTFTSTTP